MSNETKQTAVEWLVEQFENHRATFFKLNDKEERVITLAGRDVVEQAKEMEKRQRISDYYQGACDESDSHGAQYICKSDAEQWYEQTYGGNK
jgi:hypothetical protein